MKLMNKLCALSFTLMTTCNAYVGFENNTGSSCFMNATLQALFHIPAFTNFLESTAEILDQANVNLLKGFFDLYQKASMVEPSMPIPEEDFRESFCPIRMQENQQDAHEFLAYLLKDFDVKSTSIDALLGLHRPKITRGGYSHKVLSQRLEDPEQYFSLPVESDGKPIGTNLKQLMDHAFALTRAPIVDTDSVTIIEQVLQFLVSKSKAGKTAPLSERRQSIGKLLNQKLTQEIASIERNFPDDKKRPNYNKDEKNIAVRLKKLKDRFSELLSDKKRQVEDNDLTQLEHCLEFFDRYVEEKITHFPEILILHLKRLIVDYSNDRYYKSTAPISFPLELTQAYLRAYAAEAKYVEGVNYRLIAIVEHRGGIESTARKPETSGHYVCYALDPDKKWRLYNDSHVSEINIANICADNKRADKNYTPYMLFYERVDVVEAAKRPHNSALSSASSVKILPTADEETTTLVSAAARSQRKQHLLQLREDLQQVQAKINKLDGALRKMKDRQPESFRIKAK